MRPSCSLFLFFQAGPIIPEGPGPDRSGKMGQPERIRAGKVAFSQDKSSSSAIPLMERVEWHQAGQESFKAWRNRMSSERLDPCSLCTDSLSRCGDCVRILLP